MERGIDKLFQIKDDVDDSESSNDNQLFGGVCPQDGPCNMRGQECPSGKLCHKIKDETNYKDYLGDRGFQSHADLCSNVEEKDTRPPIVRMQEHLGRIRGNNVKKFPLPKTGTKN